MLRTQSYLCQGGGIQLEPLSHPPVKINKVTGPHDDRKSPDLGLYDDLRVTGLVGGVEVLNRMGFTVIVGQFVVMYSVQIVCSRRSTSHFKRLSYHSTLYSEP